MRYKILTVICFAFLSGRVCATESMRELRLGEVDVAASPKLSDTLRQEPASVTRITSRHLAARGVSSLKGLGASAPNLFMPDYGSRQTSAIYVRGIGSRIGTPAVGLYVDNVPCYDKSAFDFSFYGVESVDVIRGPQSTLYGRNVMGGVVKVNTYNPFEHEGTDLRAGFSTRDSRRHLSLTHYHRVSDRLAFSAGGFYAASDGFFKHDSTGRRMDAVSSAGGRMRAVYRPGSRLAFDATVNYEYSDEGAYPYVYTGATSGQEARPGLVGTISANLESTYRRELLNASLHTLWTSDGYTLHAVTSFQRIADRMFMDQDFIGADIYSLEQRQHIGTLSEEIILKNRRDSRWKRLTGISAFYQWQAVRAPVTFRADGVQWLNSVINGNANTYMNKALAGGAMQFVFSDCIRGASLPFLDDFDMPGYGAAFFHQTTLPDAAGVDGLTLSAGIRLDYEYNSLKYKTWYEFEHVYGLNGVMGARQVTVPMVPEILYPVRGDMEGRIGDDYLQLLPKASLQYAFGAGNVYVTVSRGYRSGGYSVQNISELMRSQMQADMMRDVYAATLPVMQPMVPRMMPQEVYDRVDAMLSAMAAHPEPDVAGLCGYEPEYAWNYEAGTHLQTADERITADFSVFLSQVRNLQLSRMSATGLGRTIVNAGRSRSAGVEASVTVHPVRSLTLSAAYGFTEAVFRDYTVSDDDGATVDCRGRHVPFMPACTGSADVSYTVPVRCGHLQSVIVGGDCALVGHIWWDEPNRYSQSAYTMLGARIAMEFSGMELRLWGRNLTDTRYHSFWFESMSRGCAQYGRPVQIGVDVQVHL